MNPNRFERDEMINGEKISKTNGVENTRKYDTDKKFLFVFSEEVV